jgi:hypothetical protein
MPMNNRLMRPRARQQAVAPSAYLSAAPSAGWAGGGSVASKLSITTLYGEGNPGVVVATLTVLSAGLLRITGSTNSEDNMPMEIVAAGQTFSGEAPYTYDITKTVTAGQTITFRAERINGNFTNVQAWIIPPAAPPAPTSLTSPSQSSGSVYLTWAAPANDGGSAITDYAVQFKVSGQPDSSYATFSDGTSTALSATVTGLGNGVGYTFRVAGVNSVGTGTFSSTATATPTAGNRLTASGWSGAGTSASKLAPPASPATFTGSPSITVGVSGTLNVSIASEDNYNGDYEVIIYISGAEVYRRDGNAANGATFTGAVTAGQTIALETSGGGARWFAATRLWVT